MTDTTEIRDIPLPTTGHNWSLGEVVYTHYTYDDTKPKGEKVVATIRSYAVAGSDIHGFVQERIKRRPLPGEGRVYERCPDDPKPDRPINIYVTDPCWVVIELDQAINWHFEPKAPGITTLSDYGNDNCDLEHVMPDGTLTGPSGPSGTGCTLIYFVVQYRPKDMDHQHFRCHIIHNGRGLEDPDQVDPDIPNDGGRFPFPLIGAGGSGESDL